MASEETTESMRLSFGTKLAFGSGAIAEAVYMGLFNTFITIFYNQVIGLSNTLIGLAIMLALIGDALTDPVVGVLPIVGEVSWDAGTLYVGRSSASRFMIYCIFNPPQVLVEDNHQIGLFAWLAVTTILSRGFLTLYHVPHLALGGELTKDQFQRSQLFSANTIIGRIWRVVAFSTRGYFFAGERIRATDGQLVPGHLDPSTDPWSFLRVRPSLSRSGPVR